MWRNLGVAYKEKGNDEDAINMLEKSSFCSSIGQGGEDGMKSMYDEVKKVVKTDGEMKKWVYEDGKVILHVTFGHLPMVTLMHNAAEYGRKSVVKMLPLKKSCHYYTFQNVFSIDIHELALRWSTQVTRCVLDQVHVLRVDHPLVPPPCPPPLPPDHRLHLHPPTPIMARKKFPLTALLTHMEHHAAIVANVTQKWASASVTRVVAASF